MLYLCTTYTGLHGYTLYLSLSNQKNIFYFNIFNNIETNRTTIGKGN